MLANEICLSLTIVCKNMCTLYRNLAKCLYKENILFLIDSGFLKKMGNGKGKKKTLTAFFDKIINNKFGIHLIIFRKVTYFL
jgi:hypothetical protein